MIHPVGSTIQCLNNWGQHVCSQHSFGLPLRMHGMHRTQFDHACLDHPRGPRGSQSCRVKRRDKSFQAQVEKLLGTDSHQTISKRSSECWLLIGHKKCFVLLCPIGEQFLLSSFREFVHDGYYLATVARFVHQAFLTRNEGTTDESKNVSDAISRSNSICTEKILFLTDHNVS